MKLVLDCVEFVNEGSNIPQLSVPKVGEYKIPVPPLSVQQEIVNECVIVDEKAKEKEKRVNEIVEEMKDIWNNITGETKRLKNVMSFTTDRIAYNEIIPESFITTDNMLQNCEGVRPYDGEPEVQSVIKYRKGDLRARTYH